MKALIAAAALATLFAMPVYAQTDEENGAEEEAVTVTAEEATAAAATISSVGDDQAKLDGYCAIMNEMEAAPEDDEAKAEELGGKMDQYLAGLGEDVADAFGTADGVDPASAEGQTLEEALEELGEKCGA
jgi:hypothetical protein